MLNGHWFSAELEELKFPTELQIPTKHFRLFLAANLKSAKSEQMIAFANEALARGMVYFCGWGEDCERMHDCVDQAAITAETVGRLKGTVMTTWHSDEDLQAAVGFFRDLALPSVEFEEESCCWVAFSLKDASWRQVIENALRAG
jgi:hypothetical protein